LHAQPFASFQALSGRRYSADEGGEIECEDADDPPRPDPQRLPGTAFYETFRGHAGRTYEFTQTRSRDFT
jgi:hypothetical protein